MEDTKKNEDKFIITVKVELDDESLEDIADKIYKKVITKILDRSKTV